jgi:hypothetical protein
MSSVYPILPSRPVQPHIHTSCNQCGSQLEFPVPLPLPRPSTLLQVRCFQCQNVISHAFYPAQVRNPLPGGVSPSGEAANANGHQPNTTQSTAARKGRKIGTQERPLETGYYDILGVPVTATTDDIKKAYRELFPPSHSSHSQLTPVSPQGVSQSSTTQTRIPTIHMQKSVSKRSQSRTKHSATLHSVPNTTNSGPKRARQREATSIPRRFSVQYLVGRDSHR